MPNITTRERKPPKAPTSADGKRTPRQKRQRDAAKILEDRKKEGTPRNVSVARVAVTFNPSPEVLSECPDCGYENWKWLTVCAQCKKQLPVAA